MSETRRRAGALAPDAKTQGTTDAAGLDEGPPRLGVSAAKDARAGAATFNLPAPLSARARLRLTHLLVGKSLIEALFVGALAVVFIHQVIRPSFRGSVDAAGAGGVSGWAVDAAAPAERVEVQLYIDGHYAARGWADESRPDVLAAGRAADEWHGFTLRPPALPPGEHEARVYAAHAAFGGWLYTLQQVDKPLRFNVAAGGAALAEDWWKAVGQR